jgi:hypothetical protein
MAEFHGWVLAPARRYVKSGRLDESWGWSLLTELHNRRRVTQVHDKLWGATLVRRLGQRGHRRANRERIPIEGDAGGD